MNKIKDWWCQKVIPLAYSNSLSYYELLEKLVTKVNELIDLVNNVAHFISTSLVTNLNFENRYANNFAVATDYTFYVSASGDDSNSGTRSNPVKTIAQAVKLASMQFCDIRIEILEAGDYDLDWITQSGNIHISTKVAGVVLEMRKNFINYASHLNLSGSVNGDLTINGNGYQFYCDGCCVELNYIHLNCDFRMYGGNVNFTNRCTVHNFTALSAYAVFGVGFKVKNTVTNRPALYLTNSYCYFGYEWSVELEADDAQTFMWLYGGEVVCTIPPTAVTPEYKYNDNRGNLLVFISSQTALSAIKALGTTNNFGTGIISNITITN